MEKNGFKIIEKLGQSRICDGELGDISGKLFDLFHEGTPHTLGTSLRNILDGRGHHTAETDAKIAIIKS